MNTEVAIIDYGLGNILSVVRACETTNIKVSVVSDPHDYNYNSPVIIPGVGAFPEAMRRLNSSGLSDTILEANEREIPILGICVGMQILFSNGEEYEKVKGLNLIEGDILKLNARDKNGNSIRLPSMGWRKITCTQNSEKYKKSLEHLNFYFVHSYYAKPTNSENIVAHYDREGFKVTAFVRKNNIIGAQFHPEKSGENGLKLLNNFLVEA